MMKKGLQHGAANLFYLTT
ncbi:Protein of unknown function [Bacillus mycoides]|nr:Protein of unknown function [Bacillus mycoides]